MKTIKRKPGRMRRAVRSVAVLLCVLAAYVVLSDMKLTPRAAIRMGEQYYGIYEPTRTVAMQRMLIFFPLFGPEKIKFRIVADFGEGGVLAALSKRKTLGNSFLASIEL